jgi:hypothetical protein
MLLKRNAWAKIRALDSRAAVGVCAALCLLFILNVTCYAQTAEEKVSAAATRLEKVLSSLKLKEDETVRLSSGIREVRNALRSGYIYLSLYKLQPVWVELVTLSYLDSKTGVETKGLAAFEEEWQSLGRELTLKEKLIISNASRSLPTAVRALDESSQSQIRPYYQSGRLYGLNTTLKEGLYYLGLAPAHLDFALWAQQLNAQNRSGLKLRSLEVELNQLETETLQAYRKPDASNSQRAFNRVNSTLKLATELNKEGRYAGALHKYLEASLYLDLIGAAALEPQKLPQLKTQSDLYKTRLAATGTDHSLGLMYWEMAHSALDQMAAAGQLNSEELKRMAVILDKVLPRYFKYVSEK